MTSDIRNILPWSRDTVTISDVYCISKRLSIHDELLIICATTLFAQETILDYAFHHLGLNGDDGVDRPVVMTEALANPNSSRASEAIIPFSP